MVQTDTYIKLGILSAIINTLIFVMIEVITAQLFVSIESILEKNFDNTSIIIGLVMFGFILSGVIGIYSNNLLSEKLSKVDRNIVSAFALLINFILWIFIVFIGTDKYFNITITERILIFPKVFVLYALTELSNPTYLWVYSGISFSVIYAILLIYFKIDEQDDY